MPELTFIFLLISMLVTPPAMISSPLPHKGPRLATENYIVLHYDNNGSGDVPSVIKYLKRKRKSYHYIIAKDGTIYKLIDPKYKAVHAGISRWNGNITMNDKSIGIAFNGNNKDVFTNEQYASAVWLIKQLQLRYPDINYDRVVGHEDVAWPRGRKSDPGKYFEWERLQLALQPKVLHDSVAIPQDSIIQSIQHMGELPETVEAEIR